MYTALRHISLLETVYYGTKYIASRSELEGVLATGAANRSPGNDKVPAEVYRISPAKFAQLTRALSAKTTLRVAEPLQFKGGLRTC